MTRKSIASMCGIFPYVETDAWYAEVLRIPGYSVPLFWSHIYIYNMCVYDQRINSLSGSNC